MTKLFTQLLLSVIVGFSATMGLSPDLKGKVVETLNEAQTLTRAVVNSALDAIAATDPSAEVSVKVSAEANASADTATDVEADSSVNIATHVEAEGTPDFESGIESVLDLDWVFGE